MKNKIIIPYILFFVLSSSSAQKAGLVLSGGGAKGIIHIGVIKALEENNIPIDYVAGTSMGAIVGGMYSMGFSPDEMISILKSDDFKNWSSGEIESKYIYYYLNSDPKPSIIDFPLRIHRLDSIRFKPNFLPTNLISPHQMNYAFVTLFSQANAVAGGSLDKLFIPFRCVASDIYNKETVVFKQGVLGDAIRASMTFPFVFKPITIDNKLLFDGGIFNNFPVDVMREDFNPGIMIGSNVSGKPEKPDETNLVLQIENMIINRSEQIIDKTEGIMFDFKNTGFTGFDFSRIDELVKIGYDSTIHHIDKIKAQITRRLPLSELTERRKEFRNSFPELKFQNVKITGIDSLKRRYIEQIFHYRNEVFTLKEFKESYYKLISDDKILEVIPHAVYNQEAGNFDLYLKIKIRDRLKLVLGGNISSSTSNQAYFGLTYQNLTEFAQTAYIDAQFGRMYNGFGIGSRIEAPTKKNWYMKFCVVVHNFDYFEGSRLFFADYRTANFSQYEAYTKLSAGIPLTMKGKMEFGIGYGVLTDNYSQNADTIAYSMKRDRSLFTVGSLFWRVESNTLNSGMYASKGKNYMASLQFLNSTESFRSVVNPTLNTSGKNDSWVQVTGKIDNYVPITRKITIGTYGEIALSTRQLLHNYTASVIQAPTFRPTPHSKTIFNEAFSANQYIALGIKPIYSVNNQLHFRTEAYWFIPYKTILLNPNKSAYYSSAFSSTKFMTETSLVFNFKNASAGMFLNYYSAGINRLNFGINIGYLLFNNKFIE